MGCFNTKPNNLSNSQGFDGKSRTTKYVNFVSYYKYIRRELKIQHFKFSRSSDDTSFKKTLAAVNGIHKQVAKTWVTLYIDYMIFIAWKMHHSSDADTIIYPPYAIQQVIRLHTTYAQNFTNFSLLITEGRGIVPCSPIKLTAKQNLVQAKYNTIKESYETTRDYLKKQLYENKSLHKTFQRQGQAETFWEDFEITSIQSEFSFSFEDLKTKENFQKILADHADKLTMPNRDSDEIIKVAKAVREILALDDISRTENCLESIYKPEIKDDDITGSKKGQKILKCLQETTFTLEFVNTLAWEQRISVDEGKKWIDEYANMLLTVISPSKKIESSSKKIASCVWQLHKQYVKEYQEFLKRIISCVDTEEDLEEDFTSKVIELENSFLQTNTRYASYYLFFARNCLPTGFKLKVLQKCINHIKEEKRQRKDSGHKDILKSNSTNIIADFNTLIITLMQLSNPFDFDYNTNQDCSKVNNLSRLDNESTNLTLINYTNPDGTETEEPLSSAISRGCECDCTTAVIPVMGQLLGEMVVQTLLTMVSNLLFCGHDCRS